MFKNVCLATTQAPKTTNEMAQTIRCKCTQKDKYENESLRKRNTFLNSARLRGLPNLQWKIFFQV